jgi:glycosyltransferase involved in cell wall biosynthesis
MEATAPAHRRHQFGSRWRSAHVSRRRTAVKTTEVDDSVHLASVVIPAHNEAQVIGRCLRSLTAEGPPDMLEVVVVCNGCTDDSADRARSAGPHVRVIELAEASKIAALNAGDEACTTFPRFYVDADVELSETSIRAVAAALAGEVRCAAPRPRFAVEDRSWPIRAFYDVWTMMPYLNDDMVGSGVYALSEDGRQRFERFPDITADDQYIMQLFSRNERVAVQEASFVVHPPRTLRGLVRMRARVYRGNDELAQRGLASTSPTGGAAAGLLHLARRLSLWPALAVYIGVNLGGKLYAKRYKGGWERDESARTGA